MRCLKTSSLAVVLGTLLIAIVGSLNRSSADFFPNQGSPNAGQVVPISPNGYLPVVFHDARFAPPATTSRYMSTIAGSTLYNEGCNQGSARQSGVVVLDFGQPQFQNSAYGTLLFDGVTFASVAQIENAVENFLSGYWNCSPDGSYVTLVIGTSNYLGSTNYSHGQAWGQMVNHVGDWISQPPSFVAKETVAGGIDAEMDYNSAQNTRDWVNGYSSVRQYYYYDYGSCDGCGSATYPTSCPSQAPNNGWTLDDIWYVAWNAPPAFPLPEIYATSGFHAGQWYCMSLYAYNKDGLRMNIKGTFTQWQACACPPSGTNKPDEGWSQIYLKLNADSRTVQDVPWSTDITWRN